VTATPFPFTLSPQTYDYLVRWNEAHKSLILAELTVCFETNFEEAAQRKSAKYVYLVEQAQARGYKAELITLQVGSRGVPDLPGFQKLSQSLSLPSKALVKLLEDVSRLALAVHKTGYQEYHELLLTYIASTCVQHLSCFLHI
jgi:hypothetical protein